MDGVKDLFAKGVVSVSSVGGDKGGETMALKESFVQGVVG